MVNYKVNLKSNIFQVKVIVTLLYFLTYKFGQYRLWTGHIVLSHK